jgi:hypothetical protein
VWLISVFWKDEKDKRELQITINPERNSKQALLEYTANALR